MRGLFNLFLVLMCIALIWGGVGGTYVALTNSEPTTMTCREFSDKPSSAKWLALTDCEIKYGDVVEAKYKFGVVEGYYAPLIPKGSPDEASAAIVSVKTEKQLLGLRRKDRFLGLVKFGIESDDNVREALEQADLKLTKNYIIIDPTEKPQLGFSATMTAFGLLIGVYLVFAAKRQINKDNDSRGGKGRPHQIPEAVPVPIPPFAQKPKTPESVPTLVGRASGE